MIGMASMEYESTDDLKKELETKNKEIKSLRELVSTLKGKVDSYESPGHAKVYYSTNRQLNDLADLMNAKSLKNVNLEDKDNKIMERTKIIHGLIKSILEMLPLLRQAGGITDNEEEDLRKPFIESVAQTRT